MLVNANVTTEREPTDMTDIIIVGNTKITKLEL